MCYTWRVKTDVSVRELRNHTSKVLRTVEGGVRLRVTVDRRPVAELVPLDSRPTWVSGESIRTALSEVRADPGLRADLDALLTQTTDEL